MKYFNLHDIFKEYNLEYTSELQDIFNTQREFITVPDRVLNYLKYIGKRELQKINPDTELAKELILILVLNLSETLVSNYKGNYKRLHWKILDKETNINNKSVYAKILRLLMKEGILEKGENHIEGKRSTQYRFTKRFYNSKLTRYNIQYDVIKRKRDIKIKELLGKCFNSPIALSQFKLMYYGNLQLPSRIQIKEHISKVAEKKNHTSANGKTLVLSSILKGKSKKDRESFTTVEDVLERVEFSINNITIPIETGVKNGNRVVTMFNFLPSIVREMVKLDGEPVKELDFSAMQPNLLNKEYSYSRDIVITHEEVTEYLNIPRRESKDLHLKFFNSPISQMKSSKLWDFYQDNHKELLDSVIEDKKVFGYKVTSRRSFERETQLMTKIVQNNSKSNLLYVFDAVYVKQSEENKLRESINNLTERLGYNLILK